MADLLHHDMKKSGTTFIMPDMPLLKQRKNGTLFGFLSFLQAPPSGHKHAIPGVFVCFTEGKGMLYYR